MHRTGTVLLALAATAWLGGCQREEPTPAGTTAPSDQAGTLQGDRGITTRVQARFYQNSAIKNSDIEVTTSDGVVTLSGSVPSTDVQQQALQQARAVEGVTRVEDQLEVAGAGAAATSGKASGEASGAPPPEAGKPGEDRGEKPDAADRISAGWLTTKIQAKYFADGDVKGRNIDVDTTNGVVTLTGEVDSDRARQRAVEIARETEGVTRVNDQLTVKGAAGGAAAPERETPASGAAPAQPTDEEIAERIQAKYFTNEDVRTSQIKVESKDGVVTLTGTVESDSQRDQAVDIARNTNGVTRVNDELKVEEQPSGTAGTLQPVPPPPAASQPREGAGSRDLSEKLDDAWITTKVQSRFFLDDTVKSGKVNVTTRDGVVTLEGIVASAEAKKQAVQIAETTDGVTRVVDRLTVQQEPSR